jgi:uncharacterized protein (TIGR00299 family) protein
VNLAYFDCFSGASGDMVLGACIDAGADIAALTSSLARLGVGGYRLEANPIKKQGFRATRATVRVEEASPPHRHLSHILKIIETAGLSEQTTSRASAIFRRLAEAEAVAHGSTVERVHFHEVGAVDAIVDIVGACLALEQLEIDEVHCSAIPTGHGTVTCAHGVMPVPAPGTAELLKGVPIAACDEPGELTTPTGAAILTTLAKAFGPMPAMTVASIGYGAGHRDGQTRPNLLRLVIGTVANPAQTDEVAVLEANLDDATPEAIGYVLEKALQAGALDAFAAPIYMKKNRPAVMVTILAEPLRQAAFEELLFRETTTFGVRSYRAQRQKLERTHVTVDTPYGPIRVKVGSRGGQVVTRSPEFEDCRAAAEAHQVALREVIAAALQAAEG